MSEKQDIFREKPLVSPIELTKGGLNELKKMIGSSRMENDTVEECNGQIVQIFDEEGTLLDETCVKPYNEPYFTDPIEEDRESEKQNDDETTAWMFGWDIEPPTEVR